MLGPKLYLGDCLKTLKAISDDSFDSLVTDPPAGISFMGKDWDGDKGGRKQWIAWMTEVMRECHRVLKPGAHGLVWALPRTSHWTATALEDAGFEVRDVVTHLFGSGFPKSLDVSKAIDKAAGAERIVVGSMKAKLPTSNGKFAGDRWSIDAGKMRDIDITAPATDAAKTWQGWGTALKPASEHWILVRKPCSEKTVADNVLKWGTGALNIDASRIGSGGHHGGKTAAGKSATYFDQKDYVSEPNKVYSQGRFPANLVLSHSPYCSDDQCDIECAIQMLDEQSSTGRAGKPSKSGTCQKDRSPFENKNHGGLVKAISYDESEVTGASRFFYCAKISKSERNAGLEGMPERKSGVMQDDNYKWTHDGKGNEIDLATRSANHHPTVKPKKLMAYLIRMITPPGGIVLDPFMGSGSTGVAALPEGFRFAGVEREPDYYEIASKRISHALEVTR